MDLLIAPNTVSAANADQAPATGTPGWATNGNPSTNTPATTLAAYEFNALMAEITNAISAAGITPSRFDNSQLARAIAQMALPPVGSVTEIATSKWSAAAMPNFVPCDGVTTRTSNVDAQLLAQFAATAFLPESMPILGTAQPFIATSIAFNGTEFCAVYSGVTTSSGEYAGCNIVVTGTDGVVWKPSSIVSAPWTKVIWTGSQFVALAQDGHIGTSPDGKTWAVTDPLNIGTFWADIVYTGTKYVAVGGINWFVGAESSDLVSWTFTNVSGTSGAQAVTDPGALAWNGSLLCAVSGQGQVLTSIDGIAWSITSSFALTQSHSWRVATDGSLFCAVGAGLSYTSTDGVHWTQGTVYAGSQPLNTPTFSAMTWSASATKFVGVSSWGLVATSPDGLNWTAATSAPSMYAVAFGNSVFVSISENGTSGYVALSSASGLTWTSSPLPGAGSQGLWTAAAFGSGKYVALNSGTDQVATSTDGINWTIGTLPASASWSAMVWNGSLFCAIATGSAVSVTSPDGVTWTQHALPSSTTWRAIAWGAGVFCAIASGGTVAATSPDGATWTAQTLSASAAWSSIAFNGSTFCAVASGGTVAATSPTGAVWTAQTLPASGSWTAIAANASGVFCAIASGGTAGATSPDGVTWTARTLPSSSTWSAIGWNGAEFCAVAAGSTNAATSPDGVTWEAITLPSAANWSALAPATGTFLITSNGSNGASGLLSASAVFQAPLIASVDNRFINILRVI
jgi:hypothetical protein